MPDLIGSIDLVGKTTQAALGGSTAGGSLVGKTAVPAVEGATAQGNLVGKTAQAELVGDIDLQGG